MPKKLPDGNFLDFSNLKNSLEASVDFYEKFKLIVENSNEIFWIVDLTKGEKVTYVSPAFKKIWGYEPSQLYKKPRLWMDAIIPEDKLKVLRAFNRLESGNARFDLLWRINPAGSKTIKWIHAIGYVVTDGGKPAFSIGTAADITALKNEEEKLRLSNERLNFAIEGNRDGVWDWNPQTGEVIFSDRWKAMLGFKPNEIKNKVSEWEKRVHPDDLPEVMRLVKLHVAGKTPYYESEHRVLCKDGTYKWILDRGKIFERDARGKPTRFVGTHTDLSKFKQLEAQLYSAKERLKHCKC